ncbi:Sulfate adenylyltransferase subunit 1 / Adenylylsulfate kinase [hydrothermal vent metagenome]|uniref:Sulfate adenylyltransferase subunit 1 / Adenylylsulfate kinase n=1 Tax=hydrothermal vent metagenome TaxID=652676 RepID=A0A3B0S1S4_9ZZZZ
MTEQPASPDADIAEFLRQQQQKDLLRFITCGSVDDGKSTLLGRLLYDSKLVCADQLRALQRDSKKSGSRGEKLDLALLVDGLAAEREQGITIDVAYRYFSTSRRKFIVADTPGHEQYTRNMATGASTADLAIILIDGQKGVQAQTRRHGFIASLLGIKNIVVAVNKMDLVNYSQRAFNQIEETFRAFAAKLDFTDIFCIPVVATDGDNVTSCSANMQWYRGAPLLEYLETVKLVQQTTTKPFRFPVQWVNRPNSDFRGFAGNVAAGEIAVDDPIIVLPSGARSSIARIVTMDGDLPIAKTGQAVTLVLNDEIDVSRGSLICSKDFAAAQSTQFQTQLIWMSEKDMFPGRSYRIKTGNQIVSGCFTELKHRINVDDLSHEAAGSLAMNEIGICNLTVGKPIAFDPYMAERATGCFIVIDPLSHATVGAGMINFSLYRASNVVWQQMEIGKTERAQQKHQKPAVLWFTGLSGSGKSTIANLVEQKLYDLGRHTYILDGDNVRHGLNKDLGFKDEDRVENIRRVAETAKLMADAGLVVLVSFISPFRAERDMARNLFAADEFLEIYVDTPLAIAEKRDVKGLYAKARAGKIKNFTGIDSEYQAPKTAEISVNTVALTAEQSADLIVKYLHKNGFLE